MKVSNLKFDEWYWCWSKHMYLRYYGRGYNARTLEFVDVNGDMHYFNDKQVEEEFGRWQDSPYVK